MDAKKYFSFLLDRPLEPVFMPKGEKGLISFVIPQDYLADEYKSRANFIIQPSATAITQVKIEELKDGLPDLTEILTLKRNATFSLFITKHRRIAGKLIEIFLNPGLDVDDLLAVAAYARDRVHPLLFNYALSVALLHRPDTKDVDLPISLIQQFPEKFINFESYFKVVKEASLVPNPDDRMPVVIQMDYTATDLDQEHRLAYFREDLGVNSHHWHWHEVYPFDGPLEVVEKDRRGELFYYMHQQLLARYNFERLCNSLNRVERFHNWDEPIDEAYFPKLVDLLAGPVPGRAAKQKLFDVKRMEIKNIFDVRDLKRWSNEIHAAIRRGYVIDSSGNTIKLTEEQGIDILGNMIESSILSPYPAFYGNLHNKGHVAISSVHDPDGRHLESLGVMARTETAMRDPVFYRWHAYLDDLFQRYKATLPSYTGSQLDYSGITIQKVEVQSRTGPANIFNTFLENSVIDVSSGMNFVGGGRWMPIQFPHLQHEPFTYTITVDNSEDTRVGTCRIFLAPKYDETREPWSFDQQKHMFIELDKFSVVLNQGENIISRDSTQSSVTIPFLELVSKTDVKVPDIYCRCGWPQHMLIPRGTREGKACELFVMISNYQHDFVDEERLTGGCTCKDAASYCGLKDKKYPDRRSMGYPFDRMPRDGVDTLQQFLTPNMIVQKCAIKFWEWNKPEKRI